MTTSTARRRKPLNMNRAARELGWIECPEGWWWRDIIDGELILNEDRIHHWMGMGPFLFAEDAEDALIADGKIY